MLIHSQFKYGWVTKREIRFGVLKKESSLMPIQHNTRMHLIMFDTEYDMKFWDGFAKWLTENQKNFQENISYRQVTAL